MSIKLAQIERALTTDRVLAETKPHLAPRERAVIALRLEYFERMAVRLQYHKNDLVSRDTPRDTLKRYYELATDLLLLASLWYPFQHDEAEDGLSALRGIEAFLLLYDAALGLLNTDFEAAEALLEQVRALRKPWGFGANPYSGYDKHVKAILGAAS